jgi:CubicO group peptidase (beta-lactamase class C family)
MAKKFFRWAFIIALSLSLGLTVLLYLTDTSYLIKGVKSTYLRGVAAPEIDDHVYFDLREVAVEEPQALYESENLNKTPLSEELEASLKRTRSVAFLVFLRDSLVQEHYWEGYGKTSHSNTFSASKTVVTLATEKAIEEGFIESWDQPIQDFVPELKGKYAPDLSFRHLSTMTGGLDWNEHYSSPFTLTAKTYYTDHLEEVMLGVEIVDRPGQVYEYQSGSTELLAIALMRATDIPLADYVSSRLWQPLGAEEAALWQLDHEGGMEIAYCCMNTNARDFARFGLLANHQGNWRGQQIIDSSFYEMATKGYRADYYGHSYWIDRNGHGTKVFYMRGRQGQYVISIPEKEIVIVRLGFRYDEGGIPHRNCFHTYVDEVLKMYDEPKS